MLRWRRNLAKGVDAETLAADPKEARPRIFADMFPDSVARDEPPTERFVSCGAAPDAVDAGFIKSLVTEVKASHTKQELPWAVPAAWMRAEFEEMGMYESVRTDIHRAFYRHITVSGLTENEAWHAATEQVNAVRQLVADQHASVEFTGPEGSRIVVPP